MMTLLTMQAPTFFTLSSNTPPAGHILPYARTDVRSISYAAVRCVRMRESLPDIPVRARGRSRNSHTPYRQVVRSPFEPSLFY